MRPGPSPAARRDHSHHLMVTCASAVSGPNKVPRQDSAGSGPVPFPFPHRTDVDARLPKDNVALLPPDASNTVLVQGIPLDAQIREIARAFALFTSSLRMPPHLAGPTARCSLAAAWEQIFSGPWSGSKPCASCVATEATSRWRCSSRTNTRLSSPSKCSRTTSSIAPSSSHLVYGYRLPAAFSNRACGAFLSSLFSPLLSSSLVSSLLRISSVANLSITLNGPYSPEPIDKTRQEQDIYRNHMHSRGGG